jgi:hypothetical protein
LTSKAKLEEQAKHAMKQMKEKGLDDMCSIMSDEELELVFKSLIKSKLYGLSSIILYYRYHQFRDRIM